MNTKEPKSDDPLSDYEILSKAGEGAYGCVMQAIDKRSGKEVAIKQMSDVFENIIDGKRILREIVLLRQLSHPNIVNLIDVFVPGNNIKKFNTIYLVLEYVPSDLKKVFKKSGFMTEEEVVKVMYQMLLGLNSIHSAGVWHRDLKPANVLLGKDNEIKICDFGLARSVEQSFSALKGMTSVHEIVNEKVSEGKPKLKTKLTSHVVTRWYRAPELILIEKDYNLKIDIWSMGCIFAELLRMVKGNVDSVVQRKAIFPGESCFPLSPDPKAVVGKTGFAVGEKDQLRVILQKLGSPSDEQLEFITDKNAKDYIKAMGQFPKIELAAMFPKSSAEAIDLLNKCLTFNPKLRPSTQDLFNHPLFKSVRDPVLEKKILTSKISFDFEKEDIKTEKRLRELFVELVFKK